MILSQITSLSIVDKDGNYVAEVLAGQDYRLGIALDVTTPGGTPQSDVTVTSVTAQLWRYLQPSESPTGGRVKVGTELVREEPSGNQATFTIPGTSLQLGEMYQLVIAAEDDTGRDWGKTWEIRVVAGV